jgi:hypothetical protein
MFLHQIPDTLKTVASRETLLICTYSKNWKTATLVNPEKKHNEAKLINPATVAAPLVHLSLVWTTANNEIIFSQAMRCAICQLR